MKNKQEVLVILIPGFPENEADSACLPSQQNLVKAINKNFTSLKIIILSFQYPFIQHEYEWHGNKVIAFNGGNKGKLSRLLLWFKVWQQLKKINNENNVTGLFSCWYGECALLGKWISKKINVRHFCWILGQDAKKGNKYVNWAMLQPTELVALSDFVRNEFYNNYAIEPKHTIPIGIEPFEFSAANRERDIDVLGAGSLIPLKRFSIFINIIKELKHYFPNIKTVLCGKGPEENKLQQMIKQSGLEKNISLTGELSHPELIATMQRTKLFMHTSSYEGFGAVCIEALYAGAAVISFCKPMNNAIPRWHIVADEKAMIQKATELLANQDAPFERVLFFSANDCAKAIMNLFGY